MKITKEDMTPPSNFLDMGELGTVNVGDKVVVSNKEYLVEGIQQGYLFSRSDNGSKLGIKVSMVEKIIPKT